MKIPKISEIRKNKQNRDMMKLENLKLENIHKQQNIINYENFINKSNSDMKRSKK